MSPTLLILAAQLLSADVELPKVLDDRLQLQLVADSPEVMTPTGIAVDDQGRVLVIESHTHFPPKDYPGPKGDRILLLSDFDPVTGKARKIGTFYEGTTHTMNLAVYRDGSVFAATRAEVFRLRDKDGDGQADERQPICRLETPGNYPHNGLSGFAFDFAGNVFFGFGENLGADYKLIGSDGKTLAGGGEGGNIYCCDAEGKYLRRVATGFWNPFHVAFDAFGRFFTVDNDPDSRPPCRLLHVVEGGDYGFKFSHGRKGTNPFTAWNGELPGTLPMVSGTGEAPSAVLAYESDNLPEEYRGDLLVTSWGDHRLERYRLKPRGASFSAEMTTVLLGGQNFRPVGLALAPDGSLYLSDWVDKSYQLHRQGRVWRLSAKSPPKPSRPEDSLAALESPHAPWREAAARKLTRDEAIQIVKQSKSERARSLAARAVFASNTRWSKALRAGNGDNGPDAGAYLANMERFSEAIARFKPADFETAAHAGEALSRLLVKDPAPGGEADPLESLKNWKPDSYLLPDQPGELRVAALWMLLDASDQGEQARDLLADPFAQTWLVENLAATLRATKADDPTTTTGPILRAILNIPPPRPQIENLCEILVRSAEKGLPHGRMLAVALRQADNHSLRPLAADLLRSRDEVQRLVGVLWIGDARLADQRSALEVILKTPSTSRQLFECTLAALALVDGKRPADLKADAPGEEYVVRLLTDDGTPAAVRRLALRMLRPDHPALSSGLLTKLLTEPDEPLRIEVIRTLRQRPDSERWPQLRQIAGDSKLSASERCEAILGLSPGNGDDRKLLLELAEGSEAAVSDEALRGLRGFDLSDSEKQRLTELAGKLSGSHKELAERVLARNPPKDQPPPSDLAAWLARAEGAGDPATGERIFFHLRVGGCFRCHEYEGRGYKVGPDLTTIGRALTRERLVQSIVDPSREIAPQFTNWSILTTDGRVLTGIHTGDEVDGRMRFADQNGRAFHVHPNDIDQRRPSSQSVMPAGLAENLTPQELRDLVAFLLGLPSK